MWVVARAGTLQDRVTWSVRKKRELQGNTIINSSTRKAAFQKIIKTYSSVSQNEVQLTLLLFVVESVDVVEPHTLWWLCFSRGFKQTEMYSYVLNMYNHNKITFSKREYCFNSPS